MGLVAHEYGYRLDEIGGLTVPQLDFLAAWFVWYQKLRRKGR